MQIIDGWQQDLSIHVDGISDGRIDRVHLRKTINWETGRTDMEIAARIESRLNPFALFQHS
jgi:hypothetical protein